MALVAQRGTEPQVESWYSTRFLNPERSYAVAAQGILTWSYALEENLVRSVVAVLMGSRRGDVTMHDEVREQADNGFVWVPRRSDLLHQEYLTHRDTYPTLDSCSGRIFTMLDELRSISDAPIPKRKRP